MTRALKWSSIVALQRPALPAMDDIASWHAAHYPDAPALVSSKATESLLTFTAGAFAAAAALVPRPTNWSQLEGPAATAWYWPDAAEKLRDHAAHVLVTLVDEAGPAIAKALSLTRLSAAVASTTPSTGVFWGPGRLVHQPDAFVQQASRMDERDLPLFLWIDFRVEPLGDGALRLFTTGLATLGGVELEVPRFAGRRDQLISYAYNVAHYQLERRKAIKDGDAIGLTENVQATVRRTPSMLDGETEVIQLDFE